MPTTKNLDLFVVKPHPDALPSGPRVHVCIKNSWTPAYRDVFKPARDHTRLRERGGI